MSYNFVFNERLGLMSNAEFGPCSAYFPRIHRNITEQEFCNILSKCVGEPMRIDWVETTPPNKNYISAFAHFNWGNKNLVNSGPVELGRYCYSLSGDRDVYSITMLQAHNPVLPTTLNIHQVSNNLKIMEDTVNAQEKRLVELEEIVRRQDDLIKKLSEHFKFPPPPILRRSLNVENIPFIPFPKMDLREEGEMINYDDSLSVSDSTHSSMPPLMRCSPDSWDDNYQCEAVVTNSEI